MAIAGSLSTAERQMNLGANRGSVNVEDSGGRVLHRRVCAIDVFGENRGRKPVPHAVGDLYGVVESATFDHRYNRTEDFLLCDPHIRLYLGEHGRLYEITVLHVAFLGAVAAAHHPGAIFFLPDIDVAK